MATAVAGAIVAGVAGSAFAATTAGVLTTAVVAAGITYGVSQLALQLFGPEVPEATNAGFELQIGGDRPRQIPLGLNKLQGHRVFGINHGGKNRTKFFSQVMVLGDWECEELSAVWVDGKRRILTPTTPLDGADAVYFVNDFNQKLKIWWHAGKASQTANQHLIDVSSGRAEEWTATARMDGICYAVVMYEDDEKTFQGQVPAVEFEIKGAKLWDIRKDTTYGGTGSHDWGDPSTWEYSENPALMDMNYHRGFYRDLTQPPVVGMQYAIADLDLNRYIASANVCDEELTEGGETRPRYACAIIASSDAEHRTTVSGIRSAMSARNFEQGGIVGVIAGAAQTVVAALTEADIEASAEDYEWSRYLPLNQVHNIFDGTYRRADTGFNPDAFDTITDPTWVAADGEPRRRSVSLQHVPYMQQAMRITRILANQNRLQATVKATFLPQHRRLQPGDWVTFGNAELGTRTYVVESRELDRATSRVKLSLRETAATVFGGAEIAVANTAVLPDDPQWQFTVTGLVIQAATLTGPGGQQLPAIQVSWDATDDSTIKEVVLEYRKYGETLAHRYSVSSPDPDEAGSAFLSEGILAGTDYQVRATIRTEPARQSVWTPWETIVTSNEYVVLSAAKASAASGALAAQLAEIGGDIDDGWLEIANLLDGPLDGWLEQINASSRITGLQVQVDSATGQILNIQEIIFGDGGSVTAQTLQAVNAAGDAGEAGVALRLQAISAPAGVTARFAVFLSGGVGADFVQAGFMIDVMPDLSRRVVFIADQFVFSDGETVPFQVDGGVVYLRDSIIKARSIAADRIELNSLSVSEILSNGITKVGFNRLVSQQTINWTGGPGNSLGLEVVMDAEGGDVLISGYISAGGQADGNANDNRMGFLTLSKNGVVVANSWVPLIRTIYGAPETFHRCNASMVYTDTDRDVGDATYRFGFSQGTVYPMTSMIVYDLEVQVLVRKDV